MLQIYVWVPRSGGEHGAVSIGKGRGFDGLERADCGCGSVGDWDTWGCVGRRLRGRVMVYSTLLVDSDGRADAGLALLVCLLFTGVAVMVPRTSRKARGVRGTSTVSFESLGVGSSIYYRRSRGRFHFPTISKLSPKQSPLHLPPLLPPSPNILF